MILIYADSIFIREEMLFVGIAMILPRADVIFIRAEMILTRVNENWSGEDWIKSRVSEI